MTTPRTRDRTKARNEPYPLGEIPREAVLLVGKQIVHRFAVGHADITGNDFGDIFAQAIGGDHRAKPLGIADVVLNGCAWSVKTVYHKNPFKAKHLRLISGRNSPDYSLGIDNPREDLQATGEAVLSIWNKRINLALGECNQLRSVMLIRNMKSREFVLFEEEAHRFPPDNFQWKENKNGNLEGFDKTTGQRHFTWQFHGSQFTIHRLVPANACKFSIDANIPVIEFQQILDLVGYKNDWITLHS